MFFMSATVLFVTSCGEDGEILPPVDDTITLTSSSRTIENDGVVAAPGQTFGVYVASGTNEVTARTDNGSVVDVNGASAATNDSIKFTVDPAAELGSTATLTFSTAGGVNEQLAVTVGYETVVDVVTFADGFSLLRAALTDDILNTLSAEAPVTVFAPTDDAFRAAGINTADDLPSNIGQILTYHVVKGAVLSTDLADGPVETLEGSDIEVTLDGGAAVNGVPVAVADIETADGNVVHVIGSVLSPAFSIINSTAVLLGSQSNTVGSFYNTLDNEVLSYAQADANSEVVDLIYYWGATNNHSIAALDDGGAQAVGTASGIDFSGFDPKQETRFASSTVTAAEFDEISSQSDLEGVITGGDITVNQTSVTALAVDNVFIMELDSDRGGNLGLVKVVEVQGAGDPNGSITIDVKMIK